MDEKIGTFKQYEPVQTFEIEADDKLINYLSGLIMEQFKIPSELLNGNGRI